MKISDVFLNKSDHTGVHFVRQTFASLAAFSLDFFLLTFLTEAVHFHYIISAIIGFLAGTVLLYFLSIVWVFSKRRFDNQKIEFGLFVLISALSLALNTGFLLLLTEVFGIFYLISRMIAATTIFFLNFIVKKILLFTNR